MIYFSSSGFWVGKKSLKTWRELYLKSKSVELQDTELGEASHAEENNDSQTLTIFNADLLCEHSEFVHRCTHVL